MSCTQFDWKAYALGELDRESASEAEGHVATCSNCREELGGLRLTLDAMATLRDEEMPRRIAFVSDKVFEPKWWEKIWSPTFASACVIAAAILVHGFVRPLGGADSQQIQAQVDRAVTKAVADVEAKHEEQMREVSDTFQMLQKQYNQVYVRAVGLVRE